MLVVTVAELLVADLLFDWMKMIKPWFVVILHAALILETPQLRPALGFVARQKDAEFPAVIAQVGRSQMVDKMFEVALEYEMTSLRIAVVVDASFSMSAKTVMKSVSLIADVRTNIFALSLLNAAELPGTNVSLMIFWQLVEIPMIILAALIVETLPLMPAMRLVARQKEAEFPAAIA